MYENMIHVAVFFASFILYKKRYDKRRISCISCVKLNVARSLVYFFSRKLKAIVSCLLISTFFKDARGIFQYFPQQGFHRKRLMLYCKFIRNLETSQWWSNIDVLNINWYVISKRNFWNVKQNFDVEYSGALLRNIFFRKCMAILGGEFSRKRRVFVSNFRNNTRTRNRILFCKNETRNLLLSFFLTCLDWVGTYFTFY